MGEFSFLQEPQQIFVLDRQPIVGYTCLIMSNYMPISAAAKLLGVAPSTLRRWEHEGKIKPVRTAGGQRRYTLAILKPHMAYSPEDYALLNTIADRLEAIVAEIREAVDAAHSQD